MSTPQLKSVQGRPSFLKIKTKNLIVRYNAMPSSELSSDSSVRFCHSGQCDLLNTLEWSGEGVWENGYNKNRQEGEEGHPEGNRGTWMEGVA